MTTFAITTVTSIDPLVRATAVMNLTLDRPDLVSITHDLLDGAVRRTVADATGVIERTIVPLDHSCVSCAIREDILPTLVGLRRQARWAHAVVALPITAEPTPLVRLLDHELRPGGQLAGAHFATAATVVDGATLRADAFSDQWLDERGLGLGDDDDRVVAEALAPMLATADMIFVVGDEPSDEALAVADHLRGDGARVVAADLDRLTEVLIGHPHGRTRDCLERADPMTLPRRTPRDRAGIWTLRLTSEQPFDAGRLRANLRSLAGHPIRARGHFWVASRPNSACQWEEAGGQLSVGDLGTWDGRTPRTELVITGTGAERDTIADAFATALHCPSDPVSEDRLDDWLGVHDDI